MTLPLRSALFMLVGLLLLLLVPQEARSQEQPPNIIFIFTDDHATHAISAYGSKINKTPNLDRIAEEGMLFRNCFCTNSICAPSRAVILTGKHSHLNGVLDNRLTFDGSQQTFPKLLQKGGYQTAMIGKWHLKSEPTGFDHWMVLRGQGTYYNPVFRTPEGQVKKIGYCTDIVTDLALDWLKEGRDKNKPFCMMYQHKAPHRAWEPGPDHLTMYDGQEIPEPSTLFDDYEGRSSAAKQQAMTLARHFSARDAKLVPPGNLTPEQLEKWNAAYGPKNEKFKEENPTGDDLVRWRYQRYIKDYLRCIASVDDNVGRLLDYLKESGLDKNTVVVYSSDQGFYLGDHGWYDKRWMYEESLRMPFIVKWPGVTKPGSENKDLVQNLDFAETFLDMAGVPIPDDMQGRSVVPLLKGNTPEDWRDSIYYHYYEFPGAHSVRRHYGVRTDRYKLIHYYVIDEWELFDLQQDPDELTSVYGTPKYAEVQERLHKELKRLREKYKVTEFEEPGLPRDPKKVSLKKVFQLQPTNQQAALVNPQGKSLGKSQANFVAGRSGKAVQFDGKTALSFGDFKPDLGYRPFSVGCWCRPENQTGTIVAQGGESYGFNLHLQEGQPHFAVRSGGELFAAKSDQSLEPNQWAHVLGAVDAKGQLHLFVNGQKQATADGKIIREKPADGFSVGADTGSLVSPDVGSAKFQGLIEDLRLYWSVLDDKQLQDWLQK